VIWAWLGAVLVGLSLGLLGSGGSILTVPILVYLVGEPEKLAIAESLAIVGLIALVGAIPYARSGLIDWRNVAWFGLPGIVGTYLGAWLSQWVSGAVQLLFFAVVMLLAAFMMLRPAPVFPARSHRRSWVVIALEGLTVGAVTGLVGVGGGFLILPALVLLGGLPMPLAVGTSLVIIAMKSASGFYKYLNLLPHHNLSVNWGLVVLFAVLGSLGSLIGHQLSRRLPQARLRQAFAAFLIAMGIFILGQNLAALLG
jgi:uncharacterized membrane protein YfcA